MFQESDFLERILKLGRKLIPRPVFEFFQPWYHGLLALSGTVIFGFPSRRLKIIGVTGTKGKSTTVFLITRFLEEMRYKTAAIGSLGYKIGVKEWPNNLKMTMPGRWKLQKFLKQALGAGCRFVVLEVTSEGIKQNRNFGVKFDAAVFTNLEKEHIESHGSFEKYYRTKQKLFRKTKNIHVLNADSPYVDLFSKFPAERKVFFKIGDWLNFKTHLQGDFNKYNILAATETVKNYGVDFETIQRALDKIKIIPGRLEFIDGGQDFKVVVDYAHTPGSLAAVYRTLKESPSTSLGTSTQMRRRLICVLGAAGGGRDKWKRPIFGQLAEKYCDEIILTDEDPYDENPLEILKDIESGFSQTLNYEKILDRKEAIKKALTSAKKDDIVVITGKGSETSIAVARGKKIPWSDKNICLELLSQKSQN